MSRASARPRQHEHVQRFAAALRQWPQLALFVVRREALIWGKALAPGVHRRTHFETPGQPGRLSVALVEFYLAIIGLL